MTNLKPLLSIHVSFLVLLGWYTNNITLISWLPNFVPMQYSAAIAYLISCLSIQSLLCNHKTISIICASVVVIISVVSLGDYFLPYKTGDLLLKNLWYQVDTSKKGLIPHYTTILLFLHSVFILLPFIIKKSNCKLTKYLQLIITSSILIIILGLISSILNHGNPGQTTLISLPTLVCSTGITASKYYIMKNICHSK